MISQDLAKQLADTQDFGGITKKNFIRILTEAPDERSIDPISDIIITAVLDSSGETDAERYAEMENSLDYAINSLTKAKNVISRLT